MNTLTETQKAYIAGFVDGEGCISITKDKRPRAGHQVTFRVCNTDKEVLDYLCAVTGLGYVTPALMSTTEHRAPRFKDCKPQWKWQFSANGMRELLPVILPYLIVKLEVTKTALELLQSSLARGIGVSEEERSRREILYARMKELNQRGINHVSI